MTPPPAPNPFFSTTLNLKRPNQIHIQSFFIKGSVLEVKKNVDGKQIIHSFKACVRIAKKGSNHQP